MMKLNDLTTHFMVYADKQVGKVRPVLVVAIDEKQVLVYKITSKYQKKSPQVKHKYFEVTDWQQSGLTRPSWIDTYSNPVWLPLNTLHQSFGHLSDDDILRFHQFLQTSKLDY